MFRPALSVTKIGAALTAGIILVFAADQSPLGPKSATGSHTPGHISEAGWDLWWNLSSDDGLRIYSVKFNGKTVFASAQLPWIDVVYGRDGPDQAAQGFNRQEVRTTGAPAPSQKPVTTVTPEPVATLVPTPTPTPIPTSTPEPTLSPTPELTATPEPTATPTPVIDWSVCQLTDASMSGTLYVSPDIGVKRRLFPDYNSSFSGGAPQNTQLTIECKRGSWYRVSDSKGSFWVPEEWVSASPVSVAPPVVNQPPVVSQPPVVTPGGGNKIVLTFDDSDSSGVLVSQILDILARYGVKAIFFPTGNWANGSGAPYVQRMLAEGHLVCNHTRDHADLTTLSRDGVIEQILGGAGVGRCNLLRPPYGAHNSYVDSIAAELGYSIYMWTIDTMDWNRRYPGGDQEILNIVLSQVYPGAIVLMHMHVDNTVSALPAMIEGLQAAGYQLSW